jgi:hypothetical protein
MKASCRRERLIFVSNFGIFILRNLNRAVPSLPYVLSRLRNSTTEAYFIKYVGKTQRENKQSMRLYTGAQSRSKSVGQTNGKIAHSNSVKLTIADLERHFAIPLNEAAKQLGVCETSLKRCAVDRLNRTIFSAMNTLNRISGSGLVENMVS